MAYLLQIRTKIHRICPITLGLDFIYLPQYNNPDRLTRHHADTTAGYICTWMRQAVYSYRKASLSYGRCCVHMVDNRACWKEIMEGLKYPLIA